MRIPRDPFLVHADREPLRQVLSNLITNSVQAMDGPGKIVITAQDRKEYARIIVADDGPGIPVDLAERVFEPLFTTRAKGTGLGLPICRQIVERHGGSIEAICTEGPGARFVLRLPVPPGGDEPARSRDE
jgi:signal transduction histidine kinase